MKIVTLSTILFLNGCANSSVTTYHKSETFIDIEVSKENFHMECDEIDKKENKSVMTFYAIDKDTVHQFIFRSISETGRCESRIKIAYNKLIENTYKIRIVGISPSSQKVKNYLVDESVPEKLKRPSSLTNWIFIRLKTVKGCEAYFDSDCDPANYWSGFFPQK